MFTLDFFFSSFNASIFKTGFKIKKEIARLIINICTFVLGERRDAV